MDKISKHIKLPRKTTSALIADSLRERVTNHEFAESEMLRQERLAQEYNVSLSPVREALIQLEAEGLVTLARHRGYTVTTLSVEDIQELYELRALVEVALLEHAIPKLQEPDLMAARKSHEAMEKICQGGKQTAAWTKVNWDFHTSLYRPAGKAQLLAVVENTYAKANRYIHLERKVRHTVDLKRNVSEHAALLEFCEARNTKKAAEVLREHLLEAGRDLAGFLQQYKKMKA